jgi:ArsR family transcriptional regulator, arsenate/arsenite/antimonite-responsive transcriptional repressor
MTDSLVFAKAMADETRQEIMHLLCCEWLCVNDVAGQLDVTQPTVSHHLAVLREAGLVNARRDGKQVYYTLNQQEVAVCCGMLMHNFAPQELEVSHPIELTEKVKEPPIPVRPASQPKKKSWQVWD